MFWLRVLASRIRGLFSKRHLERELDEELRAHIEMATEENVRRGMRPEEARQAARREFGGMEQTKEVYRDWRGLPLAETFVRDVRYGLRMLRRSPAFTTVAVLSMALGIGANTAIFSLIDAVLFESLPVHHPEQLVLLWQEASGHDTVPLSYPLYSQIRDHNAVFSGVVAFHAFKGWSVRSNGEAEPTTGQFVSGNYFSVLGITAVAGRLLSPDDDRVAGGHPVAVISYGLWKRKFALDPAAAGKVIHIFGHPFTIIGVTPPQFFGTQAGFLPEVTVPLSMQPVVMPGGMFASDSHTSWLYVMGRLKPGTSDLQARASLNVLYQQFLTAEAGPRLTPEVQRRLSEQSLAVASGSQGLNRLRKQFSFPLRILMSVVGMVLLIACANLASLLLARSAARRKEIAVRLAIGAGRFRLIRQLLTESLLVAFAGGALGLAFAFWSDTLLLKFFAVELKVQPNVQVLGFTAALCFLSGVLFGLAPALRATRADLSSALKQTGGGSGPRRLDQVLVTTQVALSLLLLVGATLFVRSLQNLKNVDAGFNREHVLLVGQDPAPNGYKGHRAAELYKMLLAKVEALPTVRSATVVQDTPLTEPSWFENISIPGYTPPGGEELNTFFNHVGAHFFETFGIPVLAGRDFESRDDETAPPVIAINESMARRYFGDVNPIGRPTSAGTIIAVVKDTKYDNLRARMRPVVYCPFLQSQASWNGAHLLAIRTAGDPILLAPFVRRVVREIDPNLSISVNTMAELVDDSLREERLFAALTSLLGLLALLLVCIGLYGVVGYAVARRVNEIGIRMALGAKPANVLWLMMRESLWLVGAGMAIGLPLAFAAAHCVASLLFGLNPVDPISLVLSLLMLLVCATLAVYLPARFASRVDPMIALHYE
ncbi:MAG TPA: ABC transporter permease [Bryobacteraceae bacterium]|nr:ABC transporter permease [Bryobacteraceae bacterium]